MIAWEIQGNKMAPIHQISEKKLQIAIFLMIKFEKYSQEYRRICVFYKELSHMVHSQIGLNYFLDDCHFGYITKSFEKTLVQCETSSWSWH
jgi:hypothetical protein